MNHNGKIPKVIVTGASGFLGQEVCKYLSSEYEVIECDIKNGYDLDDETVAQGFFEINYADYLVNCINYNDKICQADKRLNKIDIFDVDLNSLKNSLNTNIISLFSVCREFAKHNDNDYKGIVNIASTYGIVSPRNDIYEDMTKHVGYVISKAAVIMLTKHLAVCLAPRTRVNCIVAGCIENKQSNEFKENMAKQTPLRRIMQKNELNGAIEFLCSDKSSYMTGSILTIDGGYTSW